MIDAAASTLVCWQDVPPQPWRNGGGVTRELLAGPAGGDWAWRISVADIDRSGPFSAFPGVTRWFAVLSGAGVALGLPDGERRLHPGTEACRFDGAAAPACRLLAGPTRDLNLMLRGADGGLFPVSLGHAWAPPAAQAGLFTLVDGRVHPGTGVAEPMPAMSLRWWPDAPATLRFEADPVPGGACAGWWLAVRPRPAGSRR